jgi:Helix-loop-helix DNA-binding domain
MNEGYGAPTTYPCEQDTRATMASIGQNGHRAFNTTWETSASRPSNAQPLWQYPGYSSHSDTTGRQTQFTAASLPDHYDGFELEKLTCSTLSRMGEEESLSGTRRGPNSTQDHIQKGYYDRGSFAWGPSSFINSSPEAIPDSDPRSAISPSSQAFTPSTPGGPAWLSVVDSAYGSLENSSHGSGSSQADAMMHASHYFTNPEEENSPGGNSQSPTMVAAASNQQAFPETEGAATTKAGHTEQIQRLRQDAHSKVEKRYRMNINSKIEQLRRILPGSPSPEHQCLSQINTSYNPRRRKSGTELSKGDILSLAITNVQQLQNEVQQLTSQNNELREKLALMR